MTVLALSLAVLAGVNGSEDASSARGPSVSAELLERSLTAANLVVRRRRLPLGQTGSSGSGDHPQPKRLHLPRLPLSQTSTTCSGGQAPPCPSNDTECEDGTQMLRTQSEERLHQMRVEKQVLTAQRRRHVQSFQEQRRVHTFPGDVFSEGEHSALNEPKRSESRPSFTLSRRPTIEFTPDRPVESTDRSAIKASINAITAICLMQKQTREDQVGMLERLKRKRQGEAHLKAQELGNFRLAWDVEWVTAQHDMKHIDALIQDIKSQLLAERHAAELRAVALIKSRWLARSKAAGSSCSTQDTKTLS